MRQKQSVINHTVKHQNNERKLSLKNKILEPSTVQNIQGSNSSATRAAKQAVKRLLLQNAANPLQVIKEVINVR